MFAGLPDEFDTGRYHSWVVSSKNLPADLHVTAVGNDGKIMALSHREHPVSGIQFHPESVMTPYGLEILKNWMNYSVKYSAESNP